MDEKLKTEIDEWRYHFDMLRTDISSLTTRHGDTMVPPQFDNAYHLKRALEHLSDVQLQVFEAIKIKYGKGDIYGE